MKLFRKEVESIIDFNYALTRTTKVEHKAPGMCGQEYVWTDQHTDKVKCPKIELRVYSTWLTTFVPSSMLKSLCLSLFDNFDIFLTDRQTDKKGDHRSSFPGA